MNFEILSSCIYNWTKNDRISPPLHLIVTFPPDIKLCTPSFVLQAARCFLLNVSFWQGVLIFSIVVVICVFGRGKITKTYCSRRDQIL